MTVWDGEVPAEPFDVALIFDVMEHVPDYLGFLKDLHGLAAHFVFHIPLDMNAQGVARQAPILHARQSVGHLHYFSRQTAIASLEYSGYQVVDWRFTPSWETITEKSLGRKAFDSMRQAMFRWQPERTVDTLGGYALMVLASELESAPGSSGGSGSPG